LNYLIEIVPMKKLITLLFLVISFAGIAQQKVIQLYNGAAPGSENWNWPEGVNENNMFRTKIVYNVTKPTLTVYAPDPSQSNGTAIVIAPGGGFHFLSINSEGINVAEWLVKRGVTCFVLKYRLVQTKTNDPGAEMMAAITTRDSSVQQKMQSVIMMAIADGRTALEYVRSHASEYSIDPNRIGIIGFSAGGTVAGSSAFNYTAANKPNFVAPIYAYLPPEMISTVTADSPPMFIAAASDDQLKLAPHSVELYKKWLDANRPAELHLYSKGGHGFGMRVQNLPSDKWIERFGEWLDTQGLLKRK